MGFWKKAFDFLDLICGACCPFCKSRNLSAVEYQKKENATGYWRKCQGCQEEFQIFMP